MSRQAKMGLAYVLSKGELSLKQVAGHWDITLGAIKQFSQSEEGIDLMNRMLRVQPGDTAARLAKTHTPALLMRLFSMANDPDVPNEQILRAAAVASNFHRAMEAMGKGGGDENNPDLPTDSKEALRYINMQIEELQKEALDPKITPIKQD